MEGAVPMGYKRVASAAAMMLLLAGSANAAGFTAEQAAAGKIAYDGNCGRCHGMNLEGVEAPGLAGPDVMQNWDTAEGLYDFISVAMPPAAPGQLGEDTYVNIVSYIMSFNGAQPGDKAMTSDPTLLASISLPAETAAGAPVAPPNVETDVTPSASTAVPQAFTYGKPLPGGTAPSAGAAAAAPKGVPQAFTFGKTLPSASSN
jgi:mono/diheme cytochrome c family protein